MRIVKLVTGNYGTALPGRSGAALLYHAMAPFLSDSSVLSVALRYCSTARGHSRRSSPSPRVTGHAITTRHSAGVDSVQAQGSVRVIIIIVVVAYAMRISTRQLKLAL